ncbi:MAG: hypothetical protein HY822_18025 [Acidobacteria bacterium]|nr:hypothetical protein [Acidobacteriota bacterium]
MFWFVLIVMPDQETLFEMPAAECGPKTRPEEPEGMPKLKVVDRNQFKMRMPDVDTLVGADHKVRAIGWLTGTLDLSKFLAGIRTEVGHAGREHNDPRLLLAIWLYACKGAEHVLRTA